MKRRITTLVTTVVTAMVLGLAALAVSAPPQPGPAGGAVTEAAAAHVAPADDLGWG
ncbi:hypothetical protein [Streptomyces sp. NPDC049590]|uniref:hypothetical protein n=1 Tax=Streptomyces sp. NPDC049590 TaxID=3154834 RepID=UPI00342CDD1C